MDAPKVGVAAEMPLDEVAETLRALKLGVNCGVDKVGDSLAGNMAWAGGEEEARPHMALGGGVINRLVLWVLRADSDAAPLPMLMLGVDSRGDFDAELS